MHQPLSPNLRALSRVVVFRTRRGRSQLEWLLILGILTFFIWPFMQLWQIQAFPAMDTDTCQQGAIAAKNLLAQALAQPFREASQDQHFRSLAEYGDLGLEGRVEILPHPDLIGLTLVRSQVRWGYWFFKKTLTLESAVTQTRP